MNNIVATVQTLQHFTADHFSEYKAVIELFTNGKHIDVAIQINDFLVCIEIAMTSANEKINIEKDFALAKADFVVVACKDEKVLKQVLEIASDMPEHIKSRTYVWLLSELLNTHPQEFINFNLPMERK